MSGLQSELDKIEQKLQALDLVNGSPQNVRKAAETHAPFEQPYSAIAKWIKSYGGI